MQNVERYAVPIVSGIDALTDNAHGLLLCSSVTTIIGLYHITASTNRPSYGPSNRRPAVIAARPLATGPRDVDNTSFTIVNGFVRGTAVAHFMTYLIFGTEAANLPHSSRPDPTLKSCLHRSSSLKLCRHRGLLLGHHLESVPPPDATSRNLSRTLSPTLTNMFAPCPSLAASL